jgi:hypothetical protein
MTNDLPFFADCPPAVAEAQTASQTVIAQ